MERAQRVELLEALRNRVPFDHHAWLLTDPVTQVGSSPLAHVPAIEALPALIAAKYRTARNRWTVIDDVATGTGGPFGELVRSHGVSDVASLVFRDAHGTWGWLDLWRGGGTFGAGDVDRLRAFVGETTPVLRAAQAASFVEVPGALPARSGPAVLVLSPALEVQAQTPATEAYLRAMVPPDGDVPPIPAAAYNVAAQLLAVEAGVDDHPAAASVHVGHGRWVTCRAARVAAGGDIAVTIEVASPAERQQVFVRAHGLSAREAEVVDALARGGDTAEIAAALFVSQHTVQDHLKSIFAKTGARSRRALLARVAGR